ncbi:hypothetical protein D9757_003032 [Collybiopsis confluens]|uniref:Auxin efflux carrier n=1 Tax=Collybiopsis confluens TaxID=2823264 RepID=A0A8H5HXH4_9AGAR|nr:hypothetical protein D9757_003032 [Collybiopsis confluens]
MVATNSAGTLIYEGVMPLCKTYITIFLGYCVARMGYFPQSASKGASQVSMNLALPCLIFSNIVPAFTPSNISAIGPLMLLALVYIVVGCLFGFFIREICFIPKNFWYGIVVCTALSNWGNLPTSIVESVTAHPPFNGTTDVQLGISFVSIFVMVFNIIFWVGAVNVLRWDYLPNVPQGEEAMQRILWTEKPIGGLIHRWLFQNRVGRTSERKRSADESSSSKHPLSINEKDNEVEVSSHPEMLEAGDIPQGGRAVDPVRLAPRVTRQSVAAHNPPKTTPTQSPNLYSSTSSEITLQHPATQLETSSPSKWGHLLPAWFLKTIRTSSVIITPVTIALVVSLPVSVIQPLKALFTDATASGGPDWTGPDGSPPLNFVMETATFVGELCIPLSLIILGASFARMSIPKRLGALPIPAMLLVTLAKEVFVPIVGIFLTQTFVARGLIPKENLAQRFVAIFLSGTPTAVKQPTGRCESICTRRSPGYTHCVSGYPIHIHDHFINGFDSDRAVAFVGIIDDLALVQTFGSMEIRSVTVGSEGFIMILEARRAAETYK